MHPYFLPHPVPRRNDPPDEHPLVQLHVTEHNTNEGSEFLDDAIRMEDIANDRTEESIAAGSPEYIL